MTISLASLQIEFQFLGFHAYANAVVVAVGLLVLLALAVMVGASMDTAAQHRAMRRVADQRRQLAQEIDRLHGDRWASRSVEGRQEQPE